MKKKINQEVRASKGWDVLTSSAHEKKPLTYKDLATAIGIHPRATRWVLDLLYKFCKKNNLPRLTMIVISKATGFPGSGYTEYTEDNFLDELKEVFDFEWKNIENPFIILEEEINQFAEELIETPEAAEPIYCKVKSRGTSQIIFRRALLEIYDWSCAMCGCSFEETLEAAHIISFWDCKPPERLDTRNGLLLCATHHKLYDAGYLTIDENYTIHHETEYYYEDYSAQDRLLTIDIDNTTLRLPARENHHPGKNYLIRRNSGG